LTAFIFAGALGVAFLAIELIPLKWLISIQTSDIAQSSGFNTRRPFGTTLYRANSSADETFYLDVWQTLISQRYTHCSVQH
jgi:hypothetical protein